MFIDVNLTKKAQGNIDSLGATLEDEKTPFRVSPGSWTKRTFPEFLVEFL